ncbi:ricin-type beta-trefoil lectin domain protein [Streptomyces sp. NPDC023838]|uniref:RICIN domain-containing protein n=1 Tax=Streptomyces sp. NPDC023838 TaxID=3154325 RepID=UPI0033E03CB3
MIGNMMRSLRRSAVAVAAVAALTSMIGAAQPAQAYPAYHNIQIKTSTGKCLTIRNQSTSDGAVLEQNRCQNVAAQRFKSMNFGVADPVHVLRTFTDKCLTIGSASEGNTHFWPIIQQECRDGSYHQRFTYFREYDRPGTGFRSFSMGLCWTVTGGNDGARIEGDACNGSDSQRFTIVFV